jgi:dienelactone hydrolase
MKALILTLTLSATALVLANCSSGSKGAGPERLETQAGPAVVTQQVNYKANGQTMHGFLAIPEGEGPFPGVLVVHEWWGQTDYPRQRAIKLAEEGYVAFAVDMYGQGKTVEHPKDAQKFSKKVMEDMDLAEESFRTALAELRKQKMVDGQNVAAIGYCFGGAIVLEMARRGVDLKMVASFHGNLSPLVQNPISAMDTRMLIFNGGADPFVKKQAIQTVRGKLKSANIRYKFVNYKGAKHGFTNPEATANGKKYELPLAYNERADKKSWEETLKAFKIVFR